MRGKGRVPGGAVLVVDLMACLRSTAQFAVVFAFPKDWMVVCNTIGESVSNIRIDLRKATWTRKVHFR